MSTVTAKLVIDPALGVQVPYNGKPGTYEAYILKYVDERGQVKDLVKPMQSLKYKKSMENTLRELKAGDEITIVTEKNDKGFLDVQSIQKGRQELPADSAAPRSTPVAAASGGTAQRVGSTYETPEERKVKQRLIVKQATLNAAIEVTKIRNPKGGDVLIDDVLELAESFEGFIYKGVE
jgi:hypothetical protein